MSETTDLHCLDADAFYRQVHSFEHWFEAVEGYLGDLRHGHRADLVEEALDEVRRDRLVSILCNYMVAETAALEASSGLIRVAPNQAAQIFLATQVVDEARHVEVISQRLMDLGVENPEAEVERRASQSIRDFRARLLSLVGAGDWEAGIFAQNVVLEAMEFTVFQAHAQEADGVTADLLERILRDERRHIGFGENELGARLRSDAELRRRIERLRTEIDPIVLRTFEDTLEHLAVPVDERPELGRGYLQAVDRLGLE